MADTDQTPKQSAAADQQPADTVQRQVVERTVVREVREPANGPGMNTDPPDPKEHYFLASDGETKINAYGEEKGSPEDKKRMATY